MEGVTVTVRGSMKRSSTSGQQPTRVCPCPHPSKKPGESRRARGDLDHWTKGKTEKRGSKTKITSCDSSSRQYLSTNQDSEGENERGKGCSAYLGLAYLDLFQLIFSYKILFILLVLYYSYDQTNRFEDGERGRALTTHQSPPTRPDRHSSPAPRPIPLTSSP